MNTNQINQAFEKWFESQYNHKPKETNGVYMTMFADGASRGYQAATQASEIEINSLKERVEELSELLKDRQSDLDFEFNRAEQNELDCNALTEDNIQLRVVLEALVDNFKTMENGFNKTLFDKARKALATYDKLSEVKHDTNK